MAKDGMTADLKKMGAAALALMTLAILSVLGMVVLTEFKTSLPDLDNSTNTIQRIQNSTINLYLGAIAIFGTFATILALIVVVKTVIGVVKGT